MDDSYILKREDDDASATAYCIRLLLLDFVKPSAAQHPH
jgi:hypothetical protein